MAPGITSSGYHAPFPSDSESEDGVVPEESERPLTMPIAIVGMSCRFPGEVNSPETLWDLCASAKSAWSMIPRSRFDQSAWYHPNKEHVGTVRRIVLLYKLLRLTLPIQSYVTGGHFLAEDISLFDASFFNFSSEQANVRSPSGF
jgi:acyl transferase domain-containing protein